MRVLQFVIIIFSVWIQVEDSHATEGVNFFNFLTSASSIKDGQRISFSPDDGKKFRRSFEQRYGPRGKLLIESMGRGTTTSVPSIVSPLTKQFILNYYLRSWTPIVKSIYIKYNNVVSSYPTGG